MHARVTTSCVPHDVGEEAQEKAKEQKAKQRENKGAKEQKSKKAKAKQRENKQRTNLHLDCGEPANLDFQSLCAMGLE